MLERLPPKEHGKVLRTNLIKQGFADFGTPDRNPPELFLGKQIKDNWIGKDPGFRNCKARDFRLRPDSPARACACRDIPFEKIGLRDIKD